MKVPPRSRKEILELSKNSLGMRAPLSSCDVSQSLPVCQGGAQPKSRLYANKLGFEVRPAKNLASSPSHPR
ncbi:hypothetical protein L917_11521 [Phytophthora nicotianae]|uniref:Uncharacterized protein n=2 Tax=Phytophthora nicotianae TaxID=4792 RepID=W2Q1B8_PHYN3|nr:hypothetical protein PPTG_23354 [Phytophthora nicotianae INRA-310]ETL89568.1 hypothetical protein L917_11521 [Phytophthora nicotianae]ETN06314.1 hypothetical protein PPTG_23354 [Phytophthora nicotianae INRA-310]